MLQEGKEEELVYFFAAERNRGFLEEKRERTSPVTSGPISFTVQHAREKRGKEGSPALTSSAPTETVGCSSLGGKRGDQPCLSLGGRMSNVWVSCLFFCVVGWGLLFGVGVLVGRMRQGMRVEGG